MVENLNKCYENLFDIISKLPKNADIFIKRIIIKQNEICKYYLKIYNDKNDDDILEFKVSIKYILFLLKYFLDNKLINIDEYKLMENNYKKLYFDLKKFKKVV